MKRLILVLAVATAVVLPSEGTAQPVSDPEAWRADLDVLVERFEQKHADPTFKIDRASWHREIDRVRERIPQMAPHEAIVAFMRLLQLAGDGHSTVVPPVSGPYRFHRYPVNVHHFDDGLFIREAAAAYRELLGKRVVQVGTVPAEDLIEVMSEVLPHDNTSMLRWGLSVALPLAEVLHGMGIAEAKDRVSVVVEDEAGRQTTHVLEDPVPLDAETLVGMYTQVERYDTDMVSMQDPGVETPSYLARLGGRGDETYWFEHLEDEDLVYLHWNHVRDGAVPFDVFSDSLFAYLREHDVQTLLIDVRNNEGGDLTILRPFLMGLIRSDVNAPGRLFVATSPRSFSATGWLLGQIEMYTHATFVGEPPGTAPNFIGETTLAFQLPNTGLWANASHLYHQGTRAGDDRPFIAPDIAAPLTSEMYRAGRDPVLEAVLTYDVAPLEAQLEAALDVGDLDRLVPIIEGYHADPAHRYADETALINRLGYGLLRDHPERALAVFEANVRIYPDYANGWDSLGEALAGAGRTAEALAAYERAVALDLDGPTGANARRWIDSLTRE